MGTRLLLVGIDAADDLVVDRCVADGLMPVLAALRERGRRGEITQRLPLGDDAAWSSFSTGLPPSAHGRYHHERLAADGRTLVLHARRFMRVPPFWDSLAAEGMRVAVVDVPKSPLGDGDALVVADWMPHGPDSANVVCSRAAVDAGLDAQLAVDRDFDCERDLTTAELAAAYVAALDVRAAARTDAVCTLLRSAEWDLVVTAYAETHCVGHAAWHDPDVVHRVYRDVDRQLARLLDAAGVPTDVADFDAVQHLADVAFGTYGNVHVLMNNAGTGGGGTFDDVDMTSWRRAIGVNIEGTLHGILAFLPRMLANDDDGYITGTTSGSGAQGTMYSGAPYAATKTAVLSIMESLYGYLRDRGSKIRAACLFPPLTRSGMGSPMVVDMLRAGGVPAALAEPEELAQVVLEGIRTDAFWLNPTADQDRRFFGGKLAEIHAWQNGMVMAKAHAMIEQTPPDPYLWTPVVPSGS